MQEQINVEQSKLNTFAQILNENQVEITYTRNSRNIHIIKPTNITPKKLLTSPSYERTKLLERLYRIRKFEQ